MRLLTATILSLLAAPVFAADLPKAVVPEGVGVNIHFTRGHEADLDAIAAAGFRWVRMDFTWSRIERSARQFDWTDYDVLLEDLQKRELRAIFILDYSNPLYEKKAAGKNPQYGKRVQRTMAPQHPESIAAFARWAAAAAGRYHDRPILWEIWNEPNITFWHPRPEVRQYITLATAAARAIRRADPRATIVAPATSRFDWKFLEACFAAGMLEQIDAVSVHPYRRAAPETASADYARLRKLIAQHAPAAKKNMPILSGEWGYSTCTKPGAGLPRKVQAAYLVRQQLVNLLNKVPLSIWYDWQDDGPDPLEREQNFGTVTHAHKPKPSYLALRTFTGQLAGYRIERRLPVASTDDYLLLCVNARGAKKLVAWTTGKDHAVTIPLDTLPAKAFEAVDMQGVAVRIAHKNSNGQLTLEVTGGPSYVIFK